MQRHERQVARDHERTDAWRPAELVRRQRHKIRTQPGAIERQLPGALHGIAMQERAAGVRDLRRLRHRLDDPGFVVGEHERDERRPRLRGEHPVEGVEIDDPARRDRDDRRVGDCLAHRIVLDR